MQPVAIKAIDESDFDIWLALWEGYQRFYDVDIPRSVTRTTWRRFLDPAEPVYAVVAMKGGKALGLAHTVYHRSTWTAGDFCYLQDLFVARDARGLGVGRALIEHVYADARGRGSPRVYWSTNETNQEAMKLYDRVAERSDFLVYRKTID